MQLLRKLSLFLLLSALCVPAIYAVQISFSKTFVDGEVLTAGDLETMKSDITTVVNAGGGPVGLTNTQTISGNKTLSGTTTMSGILTATGVVSGQIPFIFEGNTVNDFELSLRVGDATSDTVVILPAATGSLVVWENANLKDQNLIWEGSVSNAFEQTWTIVNPTADTTIRFPDRSVTVGQPDTGVITFDRLMTANTGNVSYTGCGFKPSSLTAYCFQNATLLVRKGGGYAEDGGSVGGWGSTDAVWFDSASFFLFLAVDALANRQTATVGSYDSDGFTLAWTEVGTVPSVTYTCFVQCQE